MGFSWKMPDITQVIELINNTISGWNTLNGVNGYMFISKTDTTKYIFLPVGGYWYMNTIYRVEYGIYRTTTRYYGASFASSSVINFSSDSLNKSFIELYIGCSVRAIQLTYIYTCSRTSE